MGLQRDLDAGPGVLVILLKRLNKRIAEGEGALGLSAWDFPISFLRSPEQKCGVTQGICQV